MCCSTQGTAEPQETSEQAKTDWPGPAGLSALSRARPGLKQGCEHRQGREQGQGAGAGSRGCPRAALPALVLLPVTTGGQASVFKLCVCWENHGFEVNLLMQQNTLFLKGQQVKLCWNINLITWAAGRNGHQAAHGCSAKSC